jgi:hypothetical protein
MTDNDAEFRSAVLAYVHREREIEPDFFENDEVFEQYVDFVLGGGGCVSSMFRAFYEIHGRYPTHEEVFPPDGLRLVLGKRSPGEQGHG